MYVCYFFLILSTLTSVKKKVTYISCNLKVEDNGHPIHPANRDSMSHVALLLCYAWLQIKEFKFKASTELNTHILLVFPYKISLKSCKSIISFKQ
jgi:hypothetical protein